MGNHTPVLKRVVRQPSQKELQLTELKREIQDLQGEVASLKDTIEQLNSERKRNERGYVGKDGKSKS